MKVLFLLLSVPLISYAANLEELYRKAHDTVSVDEQVTLAAAEELSHSTNYKQRVALTAARISAHASASLEIVKLENDPNVSIEEVKGLKEMAAQAEEIRTKLGTMANISTVSQMEFENWKKFNLDLYNIAANSNSDAEKETAITLLQRERQSIKNIDENNYLYLIQLIVSKNK